MAEILESLIITFDDDDEAVSNIAYDHELNLYDTDEDGNKITTTTFYTDEEIFLLVQLKPGYELETGAIKETSGGAVNLGLVTRTQTVDKLFFPDKEKQSLSWYPKTDIITVTNSYDKPSDPIITVKDKDITVDNYPVVVDIEYEFTAYSIRARHPSGMDIDDDESFSVGLVMEATR